MPLNLSVPTDVYPADTLLPKILVIGIGGAGCNAVNNMIRANLNVIAAAFNTDAQALSESIAENKLQLGPQFTKGLGAGSSPQIGKKAAEESAEDIAKILEDIDMVFITAGMGGGTGTGGAPVIAKIAREMGILTVGVVTKPFHFEGSRRMKIAHLGLEDLQSYVDTLIIIPNQNLFLIADEDTTFSDAFKLADDVLHAGVRGVTDLIVMPGLINLDFADIRTVMSEMGKAMMGTGEAEGDSRAIKAAEAAISNPLLDNISMKGAKGVLINITGGMDMKLFEVDAAANRIKAEVDSDANIIFGSTFNQEMNGKIRVSVVATGIDTEDSTDNNHKNSTNNTINHENIARPFINKKDVFIAPEPIDPEIPLERTSQHTDYNSTETHDSSSSNQESSPMYYGTATTENKARSANTRTISNSTPQDNVLVKERDDNDIDIPAFLRRRNN